MNSNLLGWVSIIALYVIMILMMVMGLEIMDDLRNIDLKISILLMVIVSWIVGGFMAYIIHESMKEETPR